MEPALINIEDVTRQALRLLQHELQLNGVLVVTEFGIEPAFVHADPVQLQQVILNLFKNAIEALPDLADFRNWRVADHC